MKRTRRCLIRPYYFTPLLKSPGFLTLTPGCASLCISLGNKLFPNGGSGMKLFESHNIQFLLRLIHRYCFDSVVIFETIVLGA
uniref:Uncharacterized protein n=1 Tax=Anguilla anguilla TaxID=7936 RepID=A0A0E9WTH1_ANGAN